MGKIWAGPGTKHRELSAGITVLFLGQLNFQMLNKLIGALEINKSQPLDLLLHDIPEIQI